MIILNENMKVVNTLQSNWPGAEFSVWETYESLTFHNDVHVKPTKKEFDDAVTAWKAEYDAQEYARNRAKEYPSTGDQLDMMYKDTKNSTTTHAAAVEAVKTKWPKDNSGPV